MMSSCWSSCHILSIPKRRDKMVPPILQKSVSHRRLARETQPEKKIPLWRNFQPKWNCRNQDRAIVPNNYLKVPQMNLLSLFIYCFDLPIPEVSLLSKKGREPKMEKKETKEKMMNLMARSLIAVWPTYRKL